MQDGGHDGCHNHTIRGILLLKRPSDVSYNQYLVFEMPISCCSNNSEVLWFQLGPHIILKKKDDDQDCNHNYNLKRTCSLIKTPSICAL